MDEDCIGVSFWVKGFGTVDMHYFAEEGLELNKANKKFLEDKAVLAMRRLFKAIENGE